MATMMSRGEDTFLLTKKAPIEHMHAGVPAIGTIHDSAGSCNLSHDTPGSCNFSDNDRNSRIAVLVSMAIHDWQASQEPFLVKHG